MSKEAKVHNGDHARDRARVGKLVKETSKGLSCATWTQHLMTIARQLQCSLTADVTFAIERTLCHCVAQAAPILGLRVWLAPHKP